jgi:hypothetical protein
MILQFLSNLIDRILRIILRTLVRYSNRTEPTLVLLKLLDQSLYSRDFMPFMVL